MSTYKPSSSAEGFFQTHPVIPNPAVDDIALRRALRLFLPSSLNQQLDEDLKAFADRAFSPEVLRHVVSAEQDPPSLQTWDTFGRRVDILRTSEGWRALQHIGIAEGMVGIAYGTEFGEFSRVVQFAKYHVWCGSCAMVTCPSAMTDGAACLIGSQLDSETAPKATQAHSDALRSAYERLVSTDPRKAWTAGQWMTERAGGSDVRGTETRASRLDDAEQETQGWVASDGCELGPWVVDGFKWFSSATDADCAILLAKTGSGNDEISAFFAPMRKRPRDMDGSPAKEDLPFNGIYPQRLKKKLGTKALPTAEIVLKGVRAYMIGKPGEGTKQISAILNITRIHNAVSAIGFLGRGLAISKAFSRVRRSGGRLLMDIPAHVRGLAEQHVIYRANVLLTFFVVSLLGLSESHNREKSSTVLDEATFQQISCLLRLLTPVVKALTALAAIAGLRHCMESLGGVGYLENEDPNLNIARLFRDANVLAIWEGTTDVMAADVVRVLRGKQGKQTLEALKAWVLQNSGKMPPDLKHFVNHDLEAIERLLCKKDPQEAFYGGQVLLRKLGRIAVSVLLTLDAGVDNDATAWAVLWRWLELEDPEPNQLKQKIDWTERVKLDKLIVYGKASSEKAQL